MSPIRAASLHLLISCLIAATLLMLMLGIWYPGDYFKLMGGGELMFLMVGVDVCLGPLLTLIVFKPNKKSLKLDLSVIAGLQLCAILYGSYVMFSARPAFTVFVKDQFRVVSAIQIEPKDLKLGTSPEWRSLPLTGPKLAIATPPSNKQENNILLFSAINGKDWEQFPKLYQPYSKHTDEVLSKSNSISTLRKYNQNNESVINAFFQNKIESDYVYVPVKSKYAEMAAILDAKNGDFKQILDVKPW